MSESALQSEIERLHCLQALGISVYHPRFRLPGAKASVRGPWPDMDAAAPASAPPAASAPRAAGAPRVEVPSRRIEVDPAPARTAPARSAARLPPAEPEAAAPAVENFQLLFLQVDVDLALVNQIPALARPQLQDRHMLLLSNLLRWLGKPAPTQAARVFRWPLPGLEQMATSMSAETSLLHFLEQANSERAFRFLLQLGPRAVAPASAAWQGFATHSLDEMLALPALKREAWQALLPLHALLHAQS